MSANVGNSLLRRHDRKLLRCAAKMAANRHSASSIIRSCYCSTKFLTFKRCERVSIQRNLNHETDGEIAWNARKTSERFTFRLAIYGNLAVQRRMGKVTVLFMVLSFFVCF